MTPSNFPDMIGRDFCVKQKNLILFHQSKVATLIYFFKELEAFLTRASCFPRLEEDERLIDVLN
jgi:hypothetical protein